MGCGKGGRRAALFRVLARRGIVILSLPCKIDMKASRRTDNVLVISMLRQARSASVAQSQLTACEDTKAGRRRTSPPHMALPRPISAGVPHNGTRGRSLLKPFV